MGTKERKQREFQERERFLVQLADTISDRDGEAAVTMDNLVAHSDYSKGTVYKHFASKEDLLCSIYHEKFKVLFRLFKKVASLPLSTRERELGLHVAHNLFDRRYFRESIRMVAPNTSAMRDKMNPQRRQKLGELQVRFQNVIDELIQEAIDENDLRLPEGVSPDMVALANQSLSFGMIVVMYASCDDPNDESLDGFVHAQVAAAARLLDGFQWHPLSSSKDAGVVALIEKALEDDFAQLAAEHN